MTGDKNPNESIINNVCPCRLLFDTSKMRAHLTSIFESLKLMHFSLIKDDVSNELYLSSRLPTYQVDLIHKNLLKIFDLQILGIELKMKKLAKIYHERQALLFDSAKCNFSVNDSHKITENIFETVKSSKEKNKIPLLNPIYEECSIENSNVRNLQDKSLNFTKNQNKEVRSGGCMLKEVIQGSNDKKIRNSKQNIRILSNISLHPENKLNVAERYKNKVSLANN